MSIAERFGKNLKLTRKAAGLSQEEAGIRASLHRTEIGLLERGERIPRIDTLVKLAGAVGVPADELLTGLGWEPGEASPGAFRVGAPPAGFELSERAAAFRERQPKEVDAAALVREGREELERRGGS